MEILIDGNRARTIHVGFYELGTEKILAATVKNGPQAVTEAALWTDLIWEGYIGIRLSGGGAWTYPGSNSQDGYQFGALSANEEKNIEIKINIPQSPGRFGENYVPLFLGHGE